MGDTLFIVGAILKTHPITVSASHTASSSETSEAMAAMLYTFGCFFAIGVGPILTIYVSEIFPTRTRHYDLAVATSTQWLFSTCSIVRNNFLCTASRLCDNEARAHLGYKLLIFAAMNIGGFAMFSMLVSSFGAFQPFHKPKGAVWKRWTSYLALSVVRYVRLSSRSRSKNLCLSSPVQNRSSHGAEFKDCSR